MPGVTQAAEDAVASTINHAVAAGSFDFNPLDSLEPELPDRIDSPSVVQLEPGFTLNTDARLRLGRWRLPGLGYRIAGSCSGWRIVVGAPF